MTKRILTVVGTRPNIIKITRFHEVVKKHPDFQHKLVHTGQHFSPNMNDMFFEELALPLPDFSFDIDKTSVITQLADMMRGLEKVVNEYKPDLMLVVGDVNSTLAASLVANKMGIRTCHVESGLRSYDRAMPEEHNRNVTDLLADFYFITEQSGYDHLKTEGKGEERLLWTGNTMIDTLVAYDGQIRKSAILNKLNLTPQGYALMTMHRPGNVDGKEGLTQLIELIEELSKTVKVVFPIHPRTLTNLKNFGFAERLEKNTQVILTEPAGYLDFQNLILHARYVLTDSGGVQEETTFRQVPCLTLRPNTERPVTITEGTNTLLDFDNAKILAVIAQIENGTYKKGAIPKMWDGKATDRIFEHISKILA